MTPAIASRLDDIASRDATVAPLARLQSLTLRALHEDAAWREAARDATLAPATDAPLLHGAAIPLHRTSARALLDRLDDRLEEVDPLALVEASIAQREVEVEALASVARVEPAGLMTIGHLLAWPLLLAIGERIRSPQGAPPPSAPAWPHGHCPVCAAWPTLSELRGIDRERVLRCGRCAAAWPTRHLACPFCGNDDHRALRYLATEKERESRRVSVCDRCHGHVKAVATLKPLDAEDLALADLVTLDLDLVAMERGYGRPAAAAFALDVSVRERE